MREEYTLVKLLGVVGTEVDELFQIRCRELGFKRGWIRYRGLDVEHVLAQCGIPDTVHGEAPIVGVPLGEGTLEVFLDGEGPLEVTANRLCAQAAVLVTDACLNQWRQSMTNLRRRLHNDVCQALTVAILELELDSQGQARTAGLELVLDSMGLAADAIRSLMEELQAP